MTDPLIGDRPFVWVICDLAAVHRQKSAPDVVKVVRYVRYVGSGSAGIPEYDIPAEPPRISWRITDEDPKVAAADPPAARNAEGVWLYQDTPLTTEEHTEWQYRLARDPSLASDADFHARHAIACPVCGDQTRVEVRSDSQRLGRILEALRSAGITTITLQRFGQQISAQ